MNIKVTTRDIPSYRDPAVILIDQLKDVYIEGELEPVDTAQWNRCVGPIGPQIGLPAHMVPFAVYA